MRRRLLLIRRSFAASSILSSDPAAMASILRPPPAAGPSPAVPSPDAIRFGRRRFWTAAGGGKESTFPAKGSMELLCVPGVGPRNLRKLVDGGLRDLARLKQVYKDKPVGGSAEKMVHFLQSSVGIIHKSHAESITSFVEDSVVVELKEEREMPSMPSTTEKRITFCVEGNISVGKSTFLQKIANDTVELRDLVEIVPEPVSKWQDVGPDHFNILGAFYAEPQRYAYTFQNYVFVTRLMQENESSGGTKPLRLVERSIFSDRMVSIYHCSSTPYDDIGLQPAILGVLHVFVRAVHEANWLNEMELSIYDSWFDPVLSSLPGLIPDGFIYLRATPDTCHKRMMLRRRTEEGSVTLQYLRELHEKHECWLLPFQHETRRLLSASQLPCSIDPPLHPDIKDRVFYLEGTHIHPSIQKVPALVLDCEPNIDFYRDYEAKRKYALQVAAFFEFVKKMKEASTEQNMDMEAKNQHILHPQWEPILQRRQSFI